MFAQGGNCGNTLCINKVFNAVQAEISLSKSGSDCSFSAWPDGENLKGLTEQIEAIKKTDAYLFNEESKPQTATLPMFLHRKPQKQLTYTVSFDIIKA